MKLEEGETICPECRGTGDDIRYNSNEDFCPACSKCQGDGKLDWIENVVGKKPKFRIKPGVYVKEVDLSYMIPSYECIKEIKDGVIYLKDEFYLKEE